MITHSGSRLAVVTTLLVLQSIIFLLELLIFNKHMRRRHHYLLLRQLFGPALIALLGIVVIPVTFVHASRYITSAQKQCNANVDGDIAGEGTQIATGAQVGVLIVISALGSFHTKATGAKEVGAGLVLTHVSLSIAILVQMRLGTLNSVNAVVGAMILDAQNVGLSIQLAAKETLASRWQVGVVVLAQMFGFVVVPVLVTSFTRGLFAGATCRCLTVFWWAWLSNCGSSAAREMPIFWTYYACRGVSLCQISFHSLYSSPKFDAADKSERPGKIEVTMDAMDAEQEGLLVSGAQEADASVNLPPNQAENDTETRREGNGCTHNLSPWHRRSVDSAVDSYSQHMETSSTRYASRSTRLRNATHVYRRPNREVAWFKEYPATVTMMYLVHGAFSLTSMSTVHTTIANFNLGPPSPIDSVGQIISLSVAAATLGRAAWLFGKMFRYEAQEGKWNFTWPFRLKLAKNPLLFWRFATPEDYVLCYPFNHDADCLSLGAILTEPLDPTSRFETGCDIAVQDVQAWGQLGDRGSEVATLDIDKATLISNYSRRITMTANAVTTLIFEPTLAYAEQLQELLAKVNSAQNLYLVTGLKVARSIATKKETNSSIPNHISASMGREKEIRSKRPVGLLFAYRLHSIRRSRHKRVSLDGVYQHKYDW